MLDFGLYLDRGNSPCVICRQLVYSFHESKIMTKKIADFEISGIAINFEGAWWSLLLFATKPRQENCVDINAFIWILCARYRSLNLIPFGFKISYTQLLWHYWRSRWFVQLSFYDFLGCDKWLSSSSSLEK